MTTELLRPVVGPKALELYPFQAEAIESLRVAARSGNRRIILCAPTGSGKTEMAIHLIQEAQRKGSKVTFVVDGISLAEQTSARLASYGIEHGYAQAKNTRGRGEKVQVAMAQTIEKREFWTDLDLLIIDECHIQRKAIQGFARQWGGRAIGLTATPIVKGLRETWEAVVNATTTDALVADGQLAPVEIYAATEIDMKGASKTAGEWTASAVRERSGRIIGDIVSTWAKYTSEHFGGPAKTLLFSADTAHGEDLCQAFQAAGHDFRQSTYRDSDEVTSSIVEGFDVPDVLIGVAKSSALNPIPPGYRTVHDGVWEAEVSVGLAEYQRPVVRILDVLDGSHEQVAGLTRSSGAAVEQVWAFLVAPESY